MENMPKKLSDKTSDFCSNQYELNFQDELHKYSLLLNIAAGEVR